MESPQLMLLEVRWALNLTMTSFLQSTWLRRQRLFGSISERCCHSDQLNYRWHEKDVEQENLQDNPRAEGNDLDTCCDNQLFRSNNGTNRHVFKMPRHSSSFSIISVRIFVWEIRDLSKNHRTCGFSIRKRGEC
jgi:hypothetical protein